MNLIKIFARMYDLNFVKNINIQRLTLLIRPIMITKKLFAEFDISYFYQIINLKLEI